MSSKRWLPTFLAFPIGGFIAFETIGPLEGPASAAAGGLIIGLLLGVAQWLALRPEGIGAAWVAATVAATTAGAALAAVVTGAGTDVADVVLAGLVTGAAVGAAQSTLLGRGRAAAAAWTAVTAVSWSLAWPVSSTIIDLDRGWHVFGSSGALLVTVLTGLTLRRLVATRPVGIPVAQAPALTSPASYAKITA